MFSVSTRKGYRRLLKEMNAGEKRGGDVYYILRVWGHGKHTRSHNQRKLNVDILFLLSMSIRKGYRTLFNRRKCIVEEGEGYRGINDYNQNCRGQNTVSNEPIMHHHHHRRSFFCLQILISHI